MNTSTRKKSDADTNRQGHFGLGEHVGKAGEHDDEEARDDCARQQAAGTGTQG